MNRSKILLLLASSAFILSSCSKSSSPTTPQNRLPVADAGTDQIVTDIDNSGSEPVNLNGTGSSDPDGSIATYVWTENTTQLDVGATPTVNLTQGIHTITLTVTDNGGATASDNVQITVIPNTAQKIRDGWNFFKAKNYASALTKFNEVITIGNPEGNIGKGWTLAYQGDYVNALVSLNTAISAVNFSSFTDSTRADAYMGRCFVNDVQHNIATTISDGAACLAIYSQHIFRYDTDINYKDVRLIRAYNYYLQGSYTSCRDELNLIDGGNRTTVDPLALLDELRNIWASVGGVF